MKSRHFQTSALMAMLVAASPAFAQVSQTTGAIRGIVSSKKGDFVEGGTVSLRNLENGATRSVKTDMLGYYVFPLLAVGPYEITVTANTYRTAKSNRVVVTLGQTAVATFDLDVAVTEATVEVVAMDTRVDAERTSASTSLMPDDLQSLPIKGRDFKDFALLTPMVTVSSRGDLAIGGQRGVNTSTMIDGAGFNSTFFGGTLGKEAGGTPFTMSLEAVREFQVITDGASAEFGRMGGGYLNAITKSGSNQFTGSLFFYDRPKSLVAKQHFSGKEVSEFKTRQYGGTVGGPIVTDKLFYFLAFDFQRDSRPNDFTWGRSPSEPVALDPLNPADAVLISKAGSYSTRNDADTFLARFDWNINSDHTLQLRLNRSKFKGDNGSGFNVTYDSTSLEEGTTTSWVAQWNWIINANWFNEVKVTSLNENLPRSRRSDYPQVSISNVGRYGESLFNRSFEAGVTQISEIITYVSSKWQVRAGFDYNDHKISETFIPRSGGVYTFNSLVDFRAGNWNNYQQFFSLQAGVPVEQAGTLDEKEKEYSVFAQVDYRPNNNWKFGMGLRYDKQEHPGFGTADFTASAATYSRPGPLTGRIPSDSSVSPRLSFSYSPGGEGGKTVVRGSAGLFVSRTPSVFVYQVLTSNGSRAALIRFNGTVAAYPDFKRGAGFNYTNPFQFTAYDATNFTVAPPDVQTFDPNFKNPRTKRYNIGAEHVFDSGLTMGFSGASASTENLERITDLNMPATVTYNSVGRPVYSGARPNANYRTMQVYVSDSKSTYNSMTLSAKYQKEGKPFQAGIFYTFAMEKDDDSNERSFSGYGTQDTNRLRDDFSWSDNDRRDVITGYLTFQEKRFSGIHFAANVRYLGGTPYTPRFNNDQNGDGNRNDRPWGTERNSFRESGRTNVDLKMTRDFRFGGRFKLDISAEVYNLFNKVARFDRAVIDPSAATDINYKYTSSLSTLSTERSVQFGARFSF